MQSQPLSLFELNKKIKEIVKENVEPTYWVIGEISELKVNASGHCYLELLEKNEKTDYLKARARATIWSATYRMIRPYFETSTGTRLAAGIKILIRVTVEFHEIYGLSLNIIDIEPSFTVGELARKKQEIINRLTEEGVIDMNKELEFPRLPKRIAVISSKTAAGFGDFKDQLENNEYHFGFHIKLFPAIMQGDETEQTIIRALESIHQYEILFDVVVIIRGGGSQADLASFNNYRLALHIAQFPLPVLTGIGHEQDETIVDLVAHTSLKTPTAVAEFLISEFLDEDELLDELTAAIAEQVREKISLENEYVMKTGIRFSMAVRKLLTNQQLRMESKKNNLESITSNTIANNLQKMKEVSGKIRLIIKGRMLQAENHLGIFKKITGQLSRSGLARMKLNLTMLEQRNQYLNPSETMKRGYSITRSHGRLIKDGSVLKEGDILETLFHKGKRNSRVMD